VANTLAALEAGATLLDCTLQGIGRSGGNAQGEVMALLLERMGIDAGIDVARTLAAGESLVRPLMPEAYGIPAVDAVMGFAQFHSGFYDRLRRIAEETGVDAKALIVEVSKVDRANPGEELIRSVAGRLAQPASV
jgi:4-hydroxy 2-oxovalerate aldolase